MKYRFVALGVMLTGFAFLSGCAGTGELIKAEFNFDLKKYDEAIPSYENYLAKRPDSVTARNRLGFSYFKTGWLDEAISEFQSVLETDPSEPFSTYYLGLAYLKKDDFEKAINVWQGYRNDEQPLVEEEIERQITLLQIAHSHQSAIDALSREEQLMAAKPDNNTVAVCYFQDISPDKSLQAFRKGLAAMVISDLKKIKSLRVVERIRIQTLLEEIYLGQPEIIDVKAATRVGKLLGAENVVFGNLYAGSINATAKLVSSLKGTVQGTSSVSVDKESFFELPTAIVRDIARIMGISLTEDEDRAIGVPHTKVYNAAVYFGKAIDALDDGEYEDANNFFNMALREDPAFGLARQGADSCPEADFCSTGSISGMSAALFSDLSEAAVSALVDAQSEEDALTGLGGGDGGGGGG